MAWSPEWPKGAATTERLQPVKDPVGVLLRYSTCTQTLLLDGCRLIAGGVWQRSGWHYRLEDSSRIGEEKHDSHHRIEHIPDYIVSYSDIRRRLLTQGPAM